MTDAAYTGNEVAGTGVAVAAVVPGTAGMASPVSPLVARMSSAQFVEHLTKRNVHKEIVDYVTVNRVDGKDLHALYDDYVKDMKETKPGIRDIDFKKFRMVVADSN